MKIIFTAFIALMAIMMAIAVYAAKEDKKGPSDRLYEEVVESAGSLQYNWEQGKKDDDVKGAEDKDEEGVDKEGGGTDERSKYDSSYFCDNRRA